MGIMNLTPDSFSADGRLSAQRGSSEHVRYALKMVKDGADIIDVGAESSRPGAKQVPAAEEIKRLLPVLRGLVPKCPVPVSVDTYKPQVAQAALDAGAAIINNILGTRHDKRLVAMVRDYGASIVLMHMRGSFRSMHRKYTYKRLMPEIAAELRKSVEFCLEMGIKRDRIILDPGIGFSKTPEQNLSILRNLRMLTPLGFPVLIGASRKSFIGKILDVEVGGRVWGTAAATAVAIANGAGIVRVHDVAAIKQVARMTDAIISV